MRPAICDLFLEEFSLYNMDKVFYSFLELLLVFTIISIALLFTLITLKTVSRTGSDINGRHILITGGSSGIGKSLACEAAGRGAHVTIVARDQEKLDEALKDIFQVVIRQQQRIQTISLDVSKNFKQIQEKIKAAESLAGPVFMLINCAGTALCGELNDFTEEQIKKQFEVNTIGSILPTKAVVESMKEQKRGHIVFVASQAAYCGIYGFSIYSASKFALRGFAEALNMELGPYNVKVTITYPPDTDTPGFKEEQKTKPLETKLICDTSGLFRPEVVANVIIRDALAGKFSSNMGLDGFMLEHLCSGMSPVDSLVDCLIQMVYLSTFRFVGILYGFYFRRIIRKCHDTKMKNREEINRQD